MKRLRIEFARAFVKEGSHQGRGAALTRGVLSGAPAEGKVHSDQRNRRLMDQPRFDAARADDALDGGCGCRCGDYQHDRDEKGNTADHTSA